MLEMGSGCGSNATAHVGIVQRIGVGSGHGRAQFTGPVQNFGIATQPGPVLPETRRIVHSRLTNSRFGWKSSLRLEVPVGGPQDVLSAIIVFVQRKVSHARADNRAK